MKSGYNKAARESVAPGKFTRGFVASKGSTEYDTLLFSLDNREDRSWWPKGDPDCFVCKKAPGKWNTDNNAWFPMFDGVEWEWSYKKGFDRSIAPTLSAAARYAVEDQVAPLRKRGFHVHHDGLTFSELLTEFCDRFGLSEADFCVRVGEKSGEVLIGNVFISAIWRAFHAENATLILVSEEEHKAIHSSAGARK